MTAHGRSTDGAGARPDGATWAAAIALFGAFAALYRGTCQYNLSTYHDAVTHLRTVLGDHGPHPHHVLFRWIERGWLWSMGTAGGSPLEAAASAATLSALSAAAVVTVAFLLLRLRFSLSLASAAIGAALVGFSYGPWLHATVINVYITSLALLLACLLLLTGSRSSIATYVVVGVLHALAVLIHQAYVLFVVVVAVAAWTERRDLGARVRCFVAYGAVFGVLVVTTYVLAGVFGYRARSVGDFAYWITTYAHEGYAKVPGAVGIVKAAIGFGRAFFGALWVFAVPGTHDLLSRVFAHGLEDEDFLVRDVSATYAVTLLAVTIVGTALIAALPLASVRAMRETWSRHSRATLLVAATFGVFAAFFVFWKPELLEFWMPQLAMFWLLWAALVLRPDRGVGMRTAGAVLIAATLVLSNYVGGIRYLGSPGNDYYFACVDAGAPSFERDAPVLVANEYIGDYLQLFHGRAAQRMFLPGGDTYDEGALAPALLADRFSADAARRGTPVAVYVVGTSVPPALAARAVKAPEVLVERPCEVWRVAIGAEPRS